MFTILILEFLLVFQMKSVMIGAKKMRFDQYVDHCIVSNFWLQLYSWTLAETPSAPTLATSEQIQRFWIQLHSSSIS